jgi:hypothetical protein
MHARLLNLVKFNLGLNHGLRLFDGLGESEYVCPSWSLGQIRSLDEHYLNEQLHTSCHKRMRRDRARNQTIRTEQNERSPRHVFLAMLLGGIGRYSSAHRRVSGRGEITAVHTVWAMAKEQSLLIKIQMTSVVPQQGIIIDQQCRYVVKNASTQLAIVKRMCTTFFRPCL